MRPFFPAALGLALLAGCNRKDDIADRVEEHAEDRAEALDAAAASMTNALAANGLEQQARLTRRAGEERAEAIRRSDLDAGKLTGEQQNALVEGKSVGTPAAQGR